MKINALETPTRLRSVLAVVAGLVTILVTHSGMDAIMHTTGVFPPMFTPMAGRMWGLALGYRFVLSIFGCYVTARVAHSRPMIHALVLGAIGVVLSFLGAAFTWNKGPEYGPKWFAISVVLIAPPSAWLGGKIREWQLR